MNHLCACFWYFMAKIEDFSPDSWVVRLGYIDSSSLELYIISFYWTLTTVTTVGYGDIHVVSLIERIYQIIILIVGNCAYSFIISYLSNYIKIISEKNIDYEKKISILNEIKMIDSFKYQSMQAIGYKELIPYIEGKVSLETSIELIKKKLSDADLNASEITGISDCLIF